MPSTPAEPLSPPSPFLLRAVLLAVVLIALSLAAPPGSESGPVAELSAPALAQGATDTRTGHQPPAKLVRKLREARRVYSELMDLPDRRVPQSLVDQARCVAVIPRLFEGALGFGGRHGKGVLTCRDQQGVWSAPSFIEMSGGSFGLQVGFQASDVVLFFLTEGSVLSLLETQVTLGGDATVAAGPAGRSAEATTDLKLRAEIYAYAKAKGLFAGVSVQGGRLGPSAKANRRYYGRPLPAKGILFEGRVSELRPEAREFLDLLP